MSNKLEVMMNEILNKKFRKRIHSGYDPEDVDVFFDYVIQYLKEMNRNVQLMQDESKNNQKEILKLKEELQQKNNTITTLDNQVNYFRKEGYDNQRLSNEVVKMREEIANWKKTEKK
ncbi:MAG: DivIVA domain-containing protein [Mycoplasmataceae bacterium]|jgi:DivIVA domain-containing protein|nr:DivIVA domain-containing protein [Mycoplasmataceae bacterium]